jgi:AraC-like DNA-binding protein
MTARLDSEVRCWLCAWQLNAALAVRSDRDGRQPTCSDCARIRYGPSPPLSPPPRHPRPDHEEIAHRILVTIEDVVPGLPAETRHLIEVLVRRAPTLATVRRFASAFGMHSGSLQSRFARAGLPSLKDYLAMVRLIYAARYFEDDTVTCGLVAYRLDYSSPQSFNRHVKTRLGLLASAFRSVGFEAMLNRFVTTLIDPYRGQLTTFSPSPRRLPSRGQG